MYGVISVRDIYASTKNGNWMRYLNTLMRGSVRKKADIAFYAKLDTLKNLEPLTLTPCRCSWTLKSYIRTYIHISRSTRENRETHQRQTTSSYRSIFRNRSTLADVPQDEQIFNRRSKDPERVTQSVVRGRGCTQDLHSGVGGCIFHHDYSINFPRSWCHRSIYRSRTSRWRAIETSSNAYRDFVYIRMCRYVYF